MDMEIESSGRSVDRSRELSIKKPRMTVAVGDDGDKERDRGFQRYAERERSLERPLGQRGSPMMERMRAIERERERERDRESDKGGRIIEDDKNVEREREDTTTTTTTGSRGGGSQHELVSQYKTALAELTFNSKPIITNLTIIAGENSHAAKGIAATVCSHILEVPNEQKLPSLYLLDSIVKNIGGDYVKYFAARLPEVFCKAYKQVDPVTHPGMQHLFRTWKGVFPPAPLHFIEEELRFPSMNGSSSGTTTPRSSDTQSQRPGHSIHVNPKYLEARERLQQSNKAERLNSENSGDEPLHESDRSERLDRNMHTSPKGWPEAPVKRPNIQRPPRGDTFGEPVYAQKPSTGYADYDYGVDPVRPSELLMGRPNERITERNDGLERPWYGERLGEIQSSNSGGTYSQRNGYDWQKMPARGPLIDAYGNIRGPKLAPGPQSHSTAPHDIANRSSRGMPRNWQNSEEEEYMWEDTSTRLADAGRGSDKLRKGDWFPGDINKPLGLGRGKRMEPEPDLPDGHWRTVGPLSQMDQPMSDEGRIPRRELDDRLASPLLHHDVGARSSREASVEGSFLARTAQNSLVHRSLPGWTKQNITPSAHSRPRVLPMDIQSSLPSINAVQSDGPAISSFSGSMLTGIEPSPETRLGLRTSNGIGTGPPSFGPLPPVTPLSTGLSSRQRQSPRPPSPSALLPVQQLPGSPTSLSRQQSAQPVPHQQQINLTRAGHLQIKTQTSQPLPFLQQSHVPLSQMQQVLQPQNISDSSNQLPHSYVQSGSSLQQLQMGQEIQIPPQFQNRPSGMLPQQGQSLQFLQQAPGESPLLPVRSVSLPQPLVPSHPLQQPDLKSTPQPPPPSYGPPQTPGYAANGYPTNANSSLQGQTEKLLEVILNSGLLPPSAIQAGSTPKINSSSGYTGFSEFGKTQPPLHIQPPLPSGPPPAQFSAATTVSSSLPPVVSLPTPTPASSLPGPSAVLIPLSVNNLQLLHSQPARPVQPPLPPGPPPASSLVGSSSQATSSVAPPRPSMLPVSNLLNSLMAKGIISAPTESTSLPTSLPATTLMPDQLNNCSTVVASTSNLQASVSVPVAEDSHVLTTVATPPLETSVETLTSIDPVGVEFKRDRILERHASVINALYGDFPQQCTSCGLRFMSHEEHSKHMDWHASRNCEPKMKMSHGWFSCLNDWVSGTCPSVTEVVSSVFPSELNKKSEDNEEPAVPSDENQLICPLCEELFEEFYSHETDEWMCKGTVYLNVPPGGKIEGMDRSLLGPIVHEKCRSGSAAVALGGFEENDVDDEDDLGCRRKTVQY